MKKSLLLFIALVIAGLSYGQLTGNKAIPGTPPTGYATIAAAIADLNVQGVGTGGVTFNVAAGYTETLSSVTAGLITTTTSSATKPIVFQKNGSGANPLITAGTPGTGTMDYIFCILGTDYITFDGINIQENAVNTTATTQMEWGFALLKPSATDGSQNVTIKNCAISLNKTNTATYGIYSNNHPNTSTTQWTVTATTGANSNNSFFGNTISNVYGGVYLYGYADATTPYAYYDQNNSVGTTTGNTFTNFAGGSSTAYVIYVAYQNSLTVANNNINGGAATTGALYGIYGGTATNANATFNSNAITLTSGGTTGYIYCLYNSGIGTSGTTNTLGIYNNTIQNCTYPTATSAYFYGIYNAATAFTINLYGNTVNNNVVASSGYMYLCYTTSLSGGTANVYNNTVTNNMRSGVGTQSATAYMYCLYIAGSASTSIHDNQIYNNSIPAQVSYSAYLYSLYCSNSAPSQMVYNNTIHDQTIGSSYTSAHAIYGIYSYPSSTGVNTNALYNNNVYNLTITNTSSGYGYIYGIYGYYMGLNYGNSLYNITVTSATGYGYGYGYYIGGAGTFSVYKNKLYGVSIAASASGGYYYGFYVTGPTLANIYNNYISDIKSPTSVSATGLHGIYVSSGTNVNLYYNTIYLNATSTSTTTFVTNAVYISSTPTVELRNNILINTSTAPGSTTYIASAYRRSSTTLTTYANTSNNNDFFAGTPSANKLIFYDGTNSIQTLAAYKTFVSPRDANSISELPPFINIATTPYDLHINTTTPTQCESGGTTVSAPNITTDYDNDPRYPNPGYPNNILSPAVAPDIGADEFAGRILDVTPPSIVFTPFLNTSSTTARTLTTTITDATGVPTSGTGLPRLYWKINAGAWQSVAASPPAGSTYQFTFGGGVVLGDVISYYIVAQDLVTPTPNIGSNPSAGASGFTANPPACSTPPTTPYTYTIVGTICGTFNVGTGQTYTTLTAAIADLNNKEMNCPVIFLLTDANYSASETFPIVINRNPGSSATNTLTIKPATGVNATISGSVASGQIIRVLNPNTVIDGANTAGGTTRNLTITNTNTTSPTVVVIGSTGTTAITGVILKNCVIINGANTATAVIVSDGATAGSAGYFNNITIQNNSIQQAYIGIYNIAAVAAGNGTGLLVTGNDLNTAGANSIRLCAIYVQGIDGATISNNNIGNIANTVDASNLTGIWFATGTTNSTISGNTINLMDGTSTGPRGIAVSTGLSNSSINVLGNTITGLTTASSQVPYGIYVFSTTTGVTVRNNKVGTLLNSNTGGYGARGIYVVTGIAASAINLINNVVYDIKCTSDASLTYWCIGIGVEGATGGVNIYHNSVNLSGTYAGYTTATVATALYIGTANVAMDVRDNILVNTYDNTAGTGDKSYAIYCATTNAAFTPINYNDYFVSGAPGVLGYLGADQTTLAAWQTATGQDANSKNIDPAFVSATDLHPTAASLNNLGFYLTAVPTDITGALRTNPPDMGAYEFGADPVVNTTAATGVGASSATLNGTINAAGAVVSSFFDYGLTTAYGTTISGTPPSVTGSTTTPISGPITGLTPLTTYNYRARGVTGGGLIIYGPNMTFTTPPQPAPTVTTDPASNIGMSTAQLNGTVNANGASTTVSFQWGLTVSYGNNVVAIPPTVTGNTPTAVMATIGGLTAGLTYHYRCVGVNIGGTTNGLDQSFVAGCQMPANAGPITGSASVCANSTGNIYSVAPIANATGYSWTVPAGATITAGANTTSITVTFGTTSGNVTVAGVNGCGTGTSSSLSVTVNALPTPTITGPSSTCASTTGIIYTTQIGMTGYVWTITAGGTITAGAGTSSITVTWNTAGAQNVTVNYTNAAGCTAVTPTSYAVTVNARPTPTLTGPASVCAGVAGNVYTTQSGMTNYVWAVSAGGTITAGGTSTSNTVTVTWNTGGAQSVTVNYTNASGCAALTPYSLAVSVNPLPSPTINGNTSPCMGPQYVDYYTEGGMSNYVWTVSAGGTIYSGQGTAHLQVIWNTTGVQSLGINYTNASGCTLPSPSTTPVFVNPVPGSAGTITGPATVCAGQNGVGYSTTPVLNASSYTWTVPAGATIATGAGTTSITVNYGPTATSGNVTVAGTNMCGNGPGSTLAVTVNPLPAAAGTITGPAAICAPANGISYTVTAIANATGYSWSVPSGATIVSGGNTNHITVNFSASATSGVINVYGTNACGNGQVSPDFSVIVNPTPPTPLITESGLTLTSSAPSGNQWYFNGAPIPGATGQTYEATQSGDFYVIVTLNGCPSAQSNTITIVMPGISQPEGTSLTIFPVPNNGLFTVSCSWTSDELLTLEVYNYLGVQIHASTLQPVQGKAGKTLDLRPVPSGVYTVVLKTQDNKVIRRMMVNK